MSGATAAAVIAASQRRIVRQLSEAGATSPAGAISFDAERGIDRRQLQHLIRHGVVHEAGPGAYWVDEAAWAALRRKRVGFVLVALTALAAAVVVLWLFQQAMR